jgi:hypothetical protein
MTVTTDGQPPGLARDRGIFTKSLRLSPARALAVADGPDHRTRVSLESERRSMIRTAWSGDRCVQDRRLMIVLTSVLGLVLVALLGVALTALS